MNAGAVIRPTFHHVNLKTRQLQELVDWYGTVVGADAVFQDATGGVAHQRCGPAG
jgi:catechol 2,3-dioxygenase-like lactoylglutathione lyase family enzyme